MESIGVAYLEWHMLSWDWLTIGAHWSPLELEIEDIGMAELIQTVITIGAHWSPLELEIENIGMVKLIQTVLTIGAHWCPLELHIYNDTY